MNTQKVAITIPRDLVSIIDEITKQLGISRSKYISTVLLEKIQQEKDRSLKEAYDTIFSDESIRREQLDTVKWFEASENSQNNEGVEW
jgi:metal-responsive CopG/Arc/MetJ family transcriptional regulator